MKRRLASPRHCAAVIAALVAALAASSCDADVAGDETATDPAATASAFPTGETLQSALEGSEPGQLARVDTGLVARDGVAELCDMVADSYPPYCAYPVVEIIGVPFDELDLELTRGVYHGPVDIVIRFESDGTASFVEDATP